MALLIMSYNEHESVNDSWTISISKSYYANKNGKEELSSQCRGCWKPTHNTLPPPIRSFSFPGFVDGGHGTMKVIRSRIINISSNSTCSSSIKWQGILAPTIPLANNEIVFPRFAGKFRKDFRTLNLSTHRLVCYLWRYIYYSNHIKSFQYRC